MKTFLTTLFIALCLMLNAQAMDNEALGRILSSQSDSIIGQDGNWTLQAGSVVMICVTDERNNRMRIIAPIAEMSEVTDEQIETAMAANFHSALDVRYAISEEIIWVAFIHPLQELSKDQVIDALSQVYNGAMSFGSTYSSTDLVFPGGLTEEEEEEDVKPKDGGRY